MACPRTACLVLAGIASLTPGLLAQTPLYDVTQFTAVPIAEDEPGVWLGVQLSPVPPPLDAHLGLEGDGVMVGNVFVDSPADRAGVQQYDVIVEADGVRIEDGAQTFIRHIRDKVAGDRLALKVHRQGREQTLTVELGDRPGPWQALELKYEDDAAIDHFQQFGLRGKILRPGPQGWELEDLGEIDGPDIREHLRKYFDWTGDPLADGEISEGYRVDAEGHVTHVIRDEDGRITVKRYLKRDGEGKAEAQTYDNMDALREADPEAHDLLSSGSRVPTLRFLPRGGGKLHEDFTVPRPPPPSRPDLKEWRERFFQTPKRRPGAFRVQPPAASRPADARRDATPRRNTWFEVDEKGKISVHVRGDEGELTMNFDSQEQFKQHAPNLYGQFKALEDKLR